jgi:hypothetical protein
MNVMIAPAKACTAAGFPPSPLARSGYWPIYYRASPGNFATIQLYRLACQAKKVQRASLGSAASMFIDKSSQLRRAVPVKWESDAALVPPCRHTSW